MSVTTVITNGSPSANIRNICGPVNGNNSKYYVGFQGTGQAINRVQLKLANHASAQNNSTSMWQVQIYSSTSQNPSTAQVKPNALLYSSNLKSRADVNAITPNSVFFDIDFPSTFTLANGTWYVLVLLCISGTWDYGVNMVYVNCLDTRPANIFGQWTGSAWYDLSSGYYNCIAFQLQYATGGGGGCTCDWNNVPFINLKGNMILETSTATPDPKHAIEIRSKPYEFKDWQNNNQKGSIIAFLRPPGQAGQDWDVPGGHNFDVPDSASLKFTSLENTTAPGATPQNPNGKFTAYLSLVNFGVNDPNVGIACSHHFIVRKDFILNGMLQIVEGAIVLHAGKYRRWGGQPNQPTIYTGGMAGNNYNEIHFRNMVSGAYVPIRPGFIIDKQGNTGANGQVLTNTNTGLLWQNAGSVTQRIEKGQVQTNSSGDDVIVDFSPAFTTQPIITTGMLDASGRALSVTITSLSGQPQNDLRAGFRIRATTTSLVNGDHYHDNGTRFLYVEKTTTNPTNNPSNVPNHNHTYSDWYFEQVNGYDMQQGVNRRGYTSNSNVTTNIARPAQTTIHWIAIGT